MPCSKPLQPCPHNPAKHCTASVTLLSHCLVWIENLLLILYIYGWDIMINKKLVDIYYLIMMLMYIRRRMEGWTIPVRCFVPFESPRTRVPGIVFLMSVPNRVWGAMGPPCLTWLVTYDSSGGPS